MRHVVLDPVKNAFTSTNSANPEASQLWLHLITLYFPPLSYFVTIYHGVHVSVDQLPEVSLPPKAVTALLRVHCEYQLPCLFM